MSDSKVWKLLQLYRWKVESDSYTLEKEEVKEFDKLLNECEQSLKLQELVKERKILVAVDINNVETRAEAITIVEFIEQLQPQNTNKEEGKAN